MHSAYRTTTRTLASLKYWGTHLWTTLRIYGQFFFLRIALSLRNIKSYSISLRDSGLGDQLLNANFAAKTCERLGLKFSGIREASLIDEKSHREGYLKIYQYLGITDIARIQDKDLLVIPPSKTKSILSFLAHIKRGINKPSNSTKKSLCIEPPMPVCYRSIKYLKDSNGNYLSNQFSAQLKNACKIPIRPSGEEKKKILFHIRLGDVANLELLPGKIFIPWCYAVDHEGFMSLSEQSAHYRNDHLLDFALLSQNLRQQLKKTIEIVVVTDGYGSSFDYILERREIVEYLKQFNVNCNEPAIRDLKSKHKKYFHRKFIEANHIIYGENVESSIKAIEQIINADVVVSSSGHFSLGLMNNFSIKKQEFFSPSIAYLASQRKNSRKNLTAHLLSNSIEDNSKKIIQLM